MFIVIVPFIRGINTPVSNFKLLRKPSHFQHSSNRDIKGLENVLKSFTFIHNKKWLIFSSYTGKKKSVRECGRFAQLLGGQVKVASNLKRVAFGVRLQQWKLPKFLCINNACEKIKVPKSTHFQAMAQRPASSPHFPEVLPVEAALGCLLRQT
jgi:hypothetical protein